MDGHSVKQRDITSFTVKQGPIHGLKLTLVRDPRSLTAKIPGKSSPTKTITPAIPPPAPAPSVHDQSSSKSQVKVGLAPKRSSRPASSRRHQALLPVSRVKMVMKTNVKSSSVNGVSQESVVIVSKATVSRLELAMICTNIQMHKHTHTGIVHSTTGERSL